MTVIEGTRFGVVQVPDDTAIRFPDGLLGFPDEHDYVLLEPPEHRVIGYLQSIDTPALCFPVVDGALFGDGYPVPTAAELADAHGLAVESLAVLVVVFAAPGQDGLDANLLGPLVVDVNQRVGFQAALDPRRFGPRQPLARPLEQVHGASVTAAERHSGTVHG